MIRFIFVLASIFAVPQVVLGSVFTRLSPLAGGTQLIPGVTEVGGIVFHAKGLNGSILTSQLAASSLLNGMGMGNPYMIGMQSGYTGDVLGGLGGGFSEVAVRISLFDGDTGPGDFDENNNFLRMNGFGNANFSDIVVQQTTATGIDIGVSNLAGGFRDGLLDTGFFHFTDATLLQNVYTDLSLTGKLVFSLFETNFPGDNNFDFTQGIDGSFINVGTGPIVTPNGTIPEPTSGFVFGVLSIASIVRLRSRRRSRYH